MGTKITNNQVDAKFNQVNKAFTALGEDAPNIKMKKLIGTTANTQGSGVTVVHGLDYLKILDISLLLDIDTFRISDSYSESGYRVNLTVNADTVNVNNVTGDSSFVLSKPFTVLLTYEE